MLRDVTRKTFGANGDGERRELVAGLQPPPAPVLVDPDRIDGPSDREVAVDHVGEFSQVQVEAGPVVGDEDVRPSALDQLCVP